VANIRNVIEMRLNQLQEVMLIQNHLTESEQVADQISEIAKFWSILREDQRDFIQCCRIAVEERSEWKVSR
jgi:hypothetical protein